jgi:hypothetical protein
MQTRKTTHSVDTAPLGRVTLPRSGSPRAWIAEGRVDLDGHRAMTATAIATVIFAVSVNTAVPPTIPARVDLMNAVARMLGRRVEPGRASLWVFPGGYFGFDAEHETWLELGERDDRNIEREVRRVLQGFPSKSVITFGVDALNRQQAWLAERTSGDTTVRRITREATPLNQRIFSVGQHRAAVFVCGEFTGSRTSANGPFFIDNVGCGHYLEEPERQLCQCHILVDLAHQRVSGNVHAPPNRRMVHQRQMERFSRHGVGVLTHHHAGKQNNGRAHFKHQSNWIVFPEGDWVSEADIVELV